MTSSVARGRQGNEIGTLCLAALLWIGTGCGPEIVPQEQEIFQGVYYHTQMLPDTEEARGLAHIVRIDLTHEEIELYATPVDSQQVEQQGAPYQLRHAAFVAWDKALAVTVNGALFQKEGWWPLPGRPAHSTHTVVSDGVVSHVYPHSYLVWVDAENVPRIERKKPPSPSALDQAVWGIGGDEVVLREGASRPNTERTPDRRTMLALHTERQQLWMAVFEHASYRVAAETLAGVGAEAGIMLDGGGSTAMHIGAGATGIRSGTVLGGARPVATHIGVRALPIERN